MKIACDNVRRVCVCSVSHRSMDVDALSQQVRRTERLFSRSRTFLDYFPRMETGIADEKMRKDEGEE